MSDLFKTINKICLPAQVYLGISTLSILGMLFQNIGQEIKDDYRGIEVCSIYWHFLDVLWVYLFVFLLFIR